MNETHRTRIAEIEGELRTIAGEERDVERLEEQLDGREAVLTRELAELRAHQTYTIKVNRVDFPNQPRFVTGSHILDLAKVNDGKHGVAILRGGGEHDIPVEPDHTVDLEDPKNHRFKTFDLKSIEGC